MGTERSRSYPSYTLESCMAFSGKIMQGLGLSAHEREDISRTLGAAQINGTTARKMASLNQFGLLEKSGNGWSVSKLAQRILKPLSDEEKRAALKEAASSPELYADLLKSFEHEDVVPANLSIILERNHKIFASVSEHVASTFIDSIRFAGIIDDGRKFHRVATSEATAISPVTSLPAQEKISMIGSAGNQAVIHEPQHAIAMSDYRVTITGPQFSISLTASSADDFILIDAAITRVRQLLEQKKPSTLAGGDGSQISQPTPEGGGL